VNTSLAWATHGQGALTGTEFASLRFVEKARGLRKRR